MQSSYLRLAHKLFTLSVASSVYCRKCMSQPRPKALYNMILSNFVQSFPIHLFPQLTNRSTTHCISKYYVLYSRTLYLLPISPQIIPPCSESGSNPISLLKFPDHTLCHLFCRTDLTLITQNFILKTCVLVFRSNFSLSNKSVGKNHTLTYLGSLL